MEVSSTINQPFELMGYWRYRSISLQYLSILLDIILNKIPGMKLVVLYQDMNCTVDNIVETGTGTSSYIYWLYY